MEALTQTIEWVHGLVVLRRCAAVVDLLEVGYAVVVSFFRTHFEIIIKTALLEVLAHSLLVGYLLEADVKSFVVHLESLLCQFLQMGIRAI